MNLTNYYRQFEEILSSITGKKKLLLHCCCAPCASGCIERLLEKFDVTLYYFNPNITDKDEYVKRVEELKKLGKIYSLPVIDGGYFPETFYEKIKGLENEPEKGSRCTVCYDLRLSGTEKYAEENGFDYFCTTLTLSPLKDEKRLNEIGFSLENGRVKYLPSDFKKKGGYLRSIELSNEYGLYRQNYCGCEFSKRK